MKQLVVTFHGVRGSAASPGASTAKVGGHTSCVEVTYGDTRIVLDAGSGLRALGDRLVAAGPAHTTILLSHVHWDHVQGLPFFAPIYVPGHRVDVVSGPNGVMPLDAAMRRQMTAPFFPVEWDHLPAEVSARDANPNERIAVGDVEVTLARLNHPDPVWGYRVSAGGRTVVYATDTEHYAVIDPALRRLAAGADLLVYDAQYTPEEYPAKVGWGHSTYVAAAELARTAGVGQLALFHHDPRRTDEQVAEIEQRARLAFAPTVAAREGLVIGLGAEALAAA